jgi:HK97 family phage major capsid protein
MKKEFLKIAKYFANRKELNIKQFTNALTAEQKQLLLAEDNSAIDQILEAINAMPEDSADPAVAELKQMVADLTAALESNQTEFENKLQEMFKNKTQKQFVNFIQKAVEDKLFANKAYSTEIGKTYFTNANNTNVNVVYNDSEVGVAISQVPTLLDYIRQININGENSIAWNEVDGTTDASAIVAIGSGKPVRTVTHVTHTAAGDTLAVISKIPNQYAKAISMLADIYLNDMSKDLYRKLNATLLALLVAGSDLSDLVTIPTVAKAQLIDVIRLVASAIKNLYPENRVVIGLSQSALFALDSVKDENGNYINYEFASKGIDLVSVPVSGSFTETSIVAMSENVLRWYNDGIINKTSDQAYWANNQIGLMIEILNSVMVLRATDAKATCFDDYATILTDMTPEA